MLYRRVRHLAWRTLFDETVVLDLRQRLVFGLNAAAARVLAALETPCAVATLARSAGDAGGAALAAFVEELRASGLVETVGDDVAAAARRAASVTAVPPAAVPPEADDQRPRVLWQEPLGTLAFQASPPMEIGDIQCIQ